MTPERIAEISEPIEKIYSDMTDELLLNIAKHLNSSTWTWTALHEIETLEKMGALTDENIKIINKYVKKIPQAVKDAMNDSRLEALAEIEDKLEQAAKDGYLTKPVADGTVEITKALSVQAIDQLNLVNQTMLNSSLSAYQMGIYTMRQGMETITNESERDEAQQIIDFAASKTVQGTDTRTSALRQALRQLNANGITGFYDKKGRSWSAEAYVNMDIRTTVHNTYIQSIKTRQEDYGSDVFQVSAHSGARPLCYPYQGKLYSWNTGGGYITLGDGTRHKYESIHNTSYGQPAGLFGINCGHVPYPMIPHVSEMVKEEVPSKKENDKEYEESQEQRMLERKIRYCKRDLEMLGDLATDEDRQKLRDAQAHMREFIKRTGRTRHYDREQIVTEKENPPQIKKPQNNIPQTPTQYLKGIYKGTKIKPEEAEEAIQNWIDGSAYEIRLSQQGVKLGYMKDVSDDAKYIEELISKSNKHYEDGSLYRGIMADEETTDRLRGIMNHDWSKGETPDLSIDMLGTSSWTKESGIAETFAKSADEIGGLMLEGERQPVIFEMNGLKGNKFTLEIPDIIDKTQKEVIVSEKAKFDIDHVYEEDGIIKVSLYPTN